LEIIKGATAVMNICTYSYEEYLHLVKSFHGNLAPGLIIGGFMVDLAMKNLPEGEFLMPSAKHLFACPMPCRFSHHAPSVTAGSPLSTLAGLPLLCMKNTAAKACGYIWIRKN